MDPTGFETDWREGLRTWVNSYYAAALITLIAAPIVASSRQDVAQLAILDHVRRGLLANGWPAAEATKVASAVQFLVLGAATTV